jgi:crossover junction endodeoxyribonuclease RuvC
MDKEKSQNSFEVIIGIDPGTNVTGYGIIKVQSSAYSVLDFGCIRPPTKLKITDRYLIIYNSLEHLLEIYQPNVLAIETQFVHKNVQSAIKLGMARGVVIVAAKRRGISIVEYSPTKAKRAVSGNGHASKIQVQGMVQKLLNLEKLPEPHDAADALALALCHAHSLKFSQRLGIEI